MSRALRAGIFSATALVVAPISLESSVPRDRGFSGSTGLLPVSGTATSTTDTAPSASSSARGTPSAAGSDIARQALGSTAYVRAGSVYGAGVLLDAHGHLLTCLHVVEGQPRIDVTFYDAPPLTATVLDTDAALDLALLALPTDRAPAVELGSVVGLAMGDTLFTMGAPHHMAYSLSRGIVSFLKRPFGDVSYVQTDLPFNGGSSGGPVLDERGRVVAIASFVVRETQGISFALPIDYAYRRFAQRLEGAVPKNTSAFERWLASTGF